MNHPDLHFGNQIPIFGDAPVPVDGLSGRYPTSQYLQKVWSDSYLNFTWLALLASRQWGFLAFAAEPHTPHAGGNPARTMMTGNLGEEKPGP